MFLKNMVMEKEKKGIIMNCNECGKKLKNYEIYYSLNDKNALCYLCYHEEINGDEFYG